MGGCIWVSSYGMEVSSSASQDNKSCTLPRRNIQPGKTPIGYERCNVAEQLRYYREHVYDIALRQYNNNVEDLKVKPIPGLSVILENAFALVYDYIKEDTQSLADKDKYYNELQTLWDKAKLDEEKLTSSMFQGYNLDLAELIDRYKQNTDIIEKGRIPRRTIDDIVFIVYGNPNPENKKRLISPFHFVVQFCDPTYSSYIAFFDVLSMSKEKRSRKDPHWSLENGTYRMLLHDLQHVSAQIEYLTVSAIQDKPFYEEVKNNIKNAFVSAYNIQQKYKALGQNNEAAVLMDGLFMLIHERNAPFYRRYEFFQYDDNLAEFLIKNMPIIKNMHIPDYHKYGTQKYKEEYRDWEFILRDKYVDTSDNDKIKSVHDKEGNPFLPIEYDFEQKKMSRPYGNISPFGDTDPDKVQQRNERMSKALVDGYGRFWYYFADLLQNEPK